MPYVAASSGIAEGDFERLGDICENVPDVRLICLDVANGYSQFFVEYVRTHHIFSQILNILQGGCGIQKGQATPTKFSLLFKHTFSKLF